VHRTNTFWSVGDIEENPELLNTLRKKALQVCIERGKGVSLVNLKEFRKLK
jgi:hypothetical protein